MQTVAKSLVLLVVCLAAGMVFGQGFRGERFGGGRRRGNDRPVPADEIPQRVARTEEFLRGLDTNHNGMIDAEEVSGGQKSFMERIFSHMGIEPRYPIAISEIKQGLTTYYQKQAGITPAAGNGSGTGGPPPKDASGPPPADPRAGAPAAPAVGGPPGSPAGAAAPGPRADDQSPAADAAADTNGQSPAADAAPAATGPAKPAPKKSGRFLTARERLPSGLPAWFIEKDVNGDGQVTMAEFASEWTPEVAAEFNRYDLNHDGVITAAECLKVEKQRSQSSAPGGSAR
jgi:hypothetical protein